MKRLAYILRDSRPGKMEGGIIRLFIVVILAIPISAFAPMLNSQYAGTGVSLSAQIGFDGYCKEGQWIPVRVTLENQGDEVEGQVEARVDNFNNRQTTYARQISLPTVSRKEIFLYVFPEGYLSEIAVSLTANGQEVTHTTLRVNCITSSDVLYGVLSGDPTPFNFVNQVSPANGKAFVALLDPSGIPDRAQGLKGLDVLFISNIDSGLLSQTQKEAISSWLGGGGRLVVTGGMEWKKTTAGLLDLLPLTPNQTQTLNSPNIGNNQAGAASSPEDLPGGVTVATGAITAGSQVLHSQRDIPLVISKAIGLGQVDYLTFDPSVEPLRSWPGLEDFFRGLLSQSLTGHPSWSSGFQDWGSAANAVSTLPNASLPPAWLVVVFLGAYVITIGPLNYILLRHYKQRELAWISIPVLVILFSSLAFILGRELRGGRAVLNRMAVVQVWPEAKTAQVYGLVGVFSPNRGTYNLEIGEDFLAHAIPGAVNSSQNASQSRSEYFLLNDQGHTQVPGLRVDVGGIRSIALEGQTPAPQVSSTLKLKLDKGGAYLQGKVTNLSSLPLRGAVLVAPGKAISLGDLDPNQPRDIQLAIDNTSRAAQIGGKAITPYMTYQNNGNLLLTSLFGTNNYSQDPDTYRRYLLVSSLTNNSSTGLGSGADATLVGWSDSSPVPAGIEGKNYTTSDSTVYMISLNPSVSLQGGQYLLPPGLFTWSILDPGSVGEASPYDTSVNPSGFSVRFKPAIQVPHKSIDSLTLHLKSYGASGQAGIVVQLWNFNTGGWEDLQDPQWGDNSIPSPESYIDSTGEIRLRLDNTRNLGPVQIESADFTLVLGQ
jgi:hypothetical protein